MSVAKESMNVMLMDYVEITLVLTRAIVKKVIKVTTYLKKKLFKVIKGMESIVNSMICALMWSALKIKSVDQIKYH